MSTVTITETCGCGATFTTSTGYDHYAKASASQWRQQHRCTNVAPGPCANDPGNEWLIGDTGARRLSCDLRAGHLGAHEFEGGTAVWHDALEPRRPCDPNPREPETMEDA